MPYPAKTSSKAIRDAALDILEREGADGLSMRTLATKLGLTASSLYRHYPDREALEVALAAEGVRLLHAELQRVVQGRPSQDALQALAHAYLAFARARPALYNLIMVPRPPAPAPPGPGKDLWNFVLAQVGQVTGREDDTAAAVSVWSFLHGFISLERTGLFGLSGPRGGLERGLEALLTGLPNANRT